MSSPQKIIFMGTPVFAVPALSALLKAGHRVLAVVTQPDKPRGRGMSTRPSAVKELALKENITVYEPGKARDPEFIGKLASLAPDLIVVIAYGKILPASILSIPKKGCVNVHASLLPKYRGAAPINWAIINGETVTGVSTMLMDEGMDTGAVLKTEEVGIGPEDTAEDLAKKLSNAGAGLLIKTIEELSEGRLKPAAQDDSQASYAPILKKEDGRIDWKKDSRIVKNLVRGVYPWPGAYTALNGRLIKIHRGGALASGGDSPGTVVDTAKDSIKVACGSGVFEITELQPENKRRMGAGEFVQGYRLKKGDRFE